LCLSCNIKKSITPAKLSENSWNKRRSNNFQWCHLTYELILLPFLSVARHESGTRNALLGPWLNNTEVYLITFISTQKSCRINYFYKSLSSSLVPNSFFNIIYFIGSQKKFHFNFHGISCDNHYFVILNYLVIISFSVKFQFLFSKASILCFKTNSLTFLLLPNYYKIICSKFLCVVYSY
jgi:hypothetical protein